MDDRLKRTVSRIQSWDELAQLEGNVKAKGGLSDEFFASVKARTDELGLTYVVDKTGIVLSELTPAENKIVRAIGEYVGIKKRHGTNANRTLEQVRKRGLIDAAEAAVCNAKPTQGYRALVDANLEDLSYERIVLDHPEEFSARAMWYARRRLGEPNQSEKPPASTHSDIQSRTAIFLGWLKQRALENNGYLSPFSNAEAAAAIGLGTLQTYGRVQGNIQSRIDFACYLCGLPPLGCAAVAPFERAWSQEERTWEFPVRQLQNAAQHRKWSTEDFERILSESQNLPGIAHLPWRDALSRDERRVKDWVQECAREGENAAPAVSSRQPDRLPAETLRKATPEHIWTAVQLFLRGTVIHHFGDSTDYDLITDEGARLPPKAVFGVALSLALGGMKIEPKHFSGGEDSPCFRLLRDADLRIVPKGEAVPAEPEGSAPDRVWNEGGLKLGRHWKRERAAGLAAAKKAQYRRLHGRLTCERCTFDPVEVYRTEYAESCIEVHHADTEVNAMTTGHATSLDDLQCLCANCHRLVHRLSSAI